MLGRQCDDERARRRAAERKRGRSTRAEHRCEHQRLRRAQQAVGDEHVGRIDDRGRERERDPDRVERAADAAGEREQHAGERDDERRRTPLRRTLASEQHGSGDDDRRIAAHQERGERDVDPLERGEEEPGLETVEGQSQKERRQQDAQGSDGQGAPREQGEHHRRERKPERADRHDARPAVEGELDQERLQREGRRRQQAKRRSDPLLCPVETHVSHGKDI